MKIERRTDGSVTTIAFAGEFDGFNLPEVSEEIDGFIDSGARHVVFNLRELKFINSSALGYLIKTAKRLQGMDGELVLSEPSQFFQTTVRTLGIDQIFRMFSSDGEAAKHFGESGR